MFPTLIRRRSAAAALGCAAFAWIGWSGLLVPSLIRSIKTDFGQPDAGIGLFYLVYAIFYAVGSLGGGLVIERVGRRATHAAAATLLGIGLAGIAIVPSWAMFLAAAVPAGLGAGSIDGGVNGLFLDLFRSTRGRALNFVHLFFSLGAFASPLVVGLLVDAGVPWQAVVLGTALVALPVAPLFVLTEVPSGRHDRDAGDAVPLGLPLPLILLGVGIGAYVASEVGVSNWLVRFLDAAPLGVATGALSLLWAGLALGRIVSAAFSDRFDHRRLATVASLAAALGLFGAVVVPSLPMSVALFGLAGFAFGPVYPLIMAVAGDQFPGRTAAVSGFLAGMAVTGSIVYPPIMGFMSDTVGLPVAMLGAAVLAVASAGAVWLSGSPRRRARLEIPGARSA